MHRLEDQGKSGFSFELNKKTYQGYRICESSYLQLDSLNNLLTEQDVECLLDCPNGTIKAAGFILYANRHNFKDSVIKKLNELLRQDYIPFTADCSDAIIMSNLGRYCFLLIKQHNFLFKPKFRLTKKDGVRLERNNDVYEHSIIDSSKK